VQACPITIRTALISLVVPAALLVAGSAPAATGNGTSGSAAISGDGRFVAFASAASDLVAGDTNGVPDVFVRDRAARTTERVSLATGGAQVYGPSGLEAISSDGRFVLLSSAATNLVAGDTNGRQDVFLHDRLTGSTERVSVGTDGVQPNDDSPHADLSDSGQVIAFATNATNLAAGATTSVFRVYVRDRGTGTTELVGTGWAPALSADGRYVAWDAGTRILVRDRVLGTTEEVSVGNDGAQLAGDGAVASISADGRFVAFAMDELTNRDRRSTLVVRDRVQRTTLSFPARVGGDNPKISADGRVVAFESDAGVSVRDLAAGTVQVVSVSETGAPGNTSGYTGSGALSADGRFVAYFSLASNLVAEDRNGTFDVFVRDRGSRTTELVSVARAPALAARALAMHPKRPVAGAVFSVTLGVTGAGEVPGVRCPARLAGKGLRPVGATIRSGTARCTWRVPKGSKRAMLTGSIVVTSAGASIARAFATRVR
jgi:Tol biopolymer transport system component